jgi:hypothetical protein
MKANKANLTVEYSDSDLNSLVLITTHFNIQTKRIIALLTYAMIASLYNHHKSSNTIIQKIRLFLFRIFLSLERTCIYARLAAFRRNAFTEPSARKPCGKQPIAIGAPLIHQLIQVDVG